MPLGIRREEFNSLKNVKLRTLLLICIEKKCVCINGREKWKIT